MSAVPKRSHSWWWDSHISPKNSKWLADNLEEMDQNVKRMLKLIEEDGDSFAKKAEMYYKKRPELITHVEDFYRMYRALAERYDHVTGELRKNIPSELQSQGSGIGSDLGSEPPSPSAFDRTPPRPKSIKYRAAGFDFFLGSGGSSDFSRRGSDKFSSTDDSSSESDTELTKNLDDSGSQRKIIKLHDESQVLKTKLKAIDDEKFTSNSKAEENGNDKEFEGKISIWKEDFVLHNQKLLDSEKEIERLKCELEQNQSTIRDLQMQIQFSDQFVQMEGNESEISYSKQELLEIELRTKIDSLVNEMELHRNIALELQERIDHREQKIKELEEDFKQEKLKLEAEVRSLSVKSKLIESQNVEEFNKKLDEHRLKHDDLIAERDQLNEKVVNFSVNIATRDDRIREMEEHLHELHVEHAELIACCKELQKKVMELEEEVTRQKATIIETAEEKREAIRQLCFSLDHFRDGYYQLRQVLHAGHKRSSVLAS